MISLSFGGYVNTINVSNSLPSVLLNDNLGIPTATEGTPATNISGNETESNTQLDSDIADFFNYVDMIKMKYIQGNLYLN